MTATAGGGDTVAAYWASVVEASNSTKEAKRERALELLRLKEVADDFRATYLPELPAITINTAQLGPRASGKVDSVGSWGQGISILLRPNRVDPFETSAADAGLAPMLGEPSLAFGHPLKRSKAGESLRKLEAELLVIQQLVRAYQHLTVERKLNGWGAAESDLKSYGGNGSWYAAKCNEVWRKWCAAEGLPFVPVRHSRQGYEIEHPCVAEDLEEDQAFSWMRPSCSGWPMAALAQARDPRISGPAPKTIKVGGDHHLIHMDEEKWLRWCLEDQRQAFAAIQYAGGKALLADALAYPEGQQPEIDEVDGEQLVKMPVISKPIQTSARVNVNYDAADALQTMEALLAGVDLERGTELWPTFLQLANDHPQAPGASRVQTELEIGLNAPGIDTSELTLRRPCGLRLFNTEPTILGRTHGKASALSNQRNGGAFLRQAEKFTTPADAANYLTSAGQTLALALEATRHSVNDLRQAVEQSGAWQHLNPEEGNRPESLDDWWDQIFAQISKPTDEPTPLKPGEVDLAAVIAAQFNVPVEQAAAVADRVALFLNPRPEPEPEPEPSQSDLRKQRKPRTVLSEEADQALIATIREHLDMEEPPRGWKAALARQYDVAASGITQRIKALEVA